MLANAVEARFSPEEIKQIRRGERSCAECRIESLVHGLEEYEHMREEKNICPECDWAYMGYIEAVRVLAKRIEGPSRLLSGFSTVVSTRVWKCLVAICAPLAVGAHLCLGESE